MQLASNAEEKSYTLFKCHSLNDPASSKNYLLTSSLCTETKGVNAALPQRSELRSCVKVDVAPNP